MQIHRWSLKILIISCITIMGLIAAASAPLAGYYYQRFALDSQRKALREIIQIQTRSVIDDMYAEAEELGRTLESDEGFREALRSNDQAALKEMLDSQHHQYFVTAGILKLKDLVILDKTMQVQVHSPAENSTDMAPTAHCTGQLQAALNRTGADRLKPMHTLCRHGDDLHGAVLIPLGGLLVRGYLQVVTDPTWNLRQLAPALGLPLRLRNLNNQAVYQTDDWSTKSDHAVIADGPVVTSDGTPGLFVEVGSDTTQLISRISTARMIILAISLTVTLVIVALIILLLQKTTFMPLQLLRETLKSLSSDRQAFGTELPVRGQKEIRALTRGFNEMSQALRASYDSLEKHRQELENEVARRTSDLQLAKDEAQQANRAKTQFLANMSHELRTPLNAIIGYSEMITDEMSEDPLSAETRQTIRGDLDKILNAGKHLLLLINDVLDLSKIEAGKMDLYLEKIDIRSLVAGLSDTILPMARKNGNEIVIGCPDDIGDMVADITKLRQTLFNILSNACKFTSQGRISIDVVKYNELGTEYISFAISDTGIGIPNDKLIHLFKAFSQADSGTTRRFGGTGLGLVLSRHFCRMMGGDIAVTSEPDAGSRFTVFIPVEVKPQVATLAPTPPEEEEGYSDPHRVRLRTAVPPHGTERRQYITRVLIIDDDATIRDLLSRFLSREGFHVFSAVSGMEGLAMARELLPDVITLDIMMPEIDGWAVLSELKKDPALRAIPVIMLSLIEDRNMGFALGATDYIAKPVQRDTLLDSIRRIIRVKPNRPVLIVEDEADIREMVSRTLEREGWQTVCAINGRDAIRKLQQQLPALILLDLMMPEMDGFEFISKIRQEPAWRTIPIIVLTAMDLSTEQREFLQAGTEHIMHKGSFEKSELLSQVHFSIRTFIRREMKEIQTNADPANPDEID